MAARLPASAPFSASRMLGFGVVLARHVEHVHALVGERAHRRVDGLRREVGAVQRHHDVSHGQRTSFPPQRHEIGQLIRW